MAVTGELNEAITALGDVGYCVSGNLLTPEHVESLGILARQKQRSGLLRPARVGQDKLTDSSVRGDSILWIEDSSQDEATGELLASLEALQQQLNEALLLSLHEVEVHWAIYPPGARYQRHLDQFASVHQTRKVSMVLYLNRDWQREHGGQLRLFLDDTDTNYVDIDPLGGRLVLFDSARFSHEVLPSSRERLSITGWFRTRSSIF